MATGVKQDTRFKPGQSGNPKGRPRGVASAQAKLRAAVKHDIPGIIEAVVIQAKGGDMAAAKLILDRIWPGLKSQSLPIALPGLATASTDTERAHEVMQAVAQGELAPDVATGLLGALGAVARVREIDDLARRLEALENNASTKALAIDVPMTGDSPEANGNGSN